MRLVAKNYIDIIAYAFSLCFILAGTLVSLNRFWQYEVFYYDFGIFDRAIWEVSKFRPPIIDHLIVGGKWIFADHFNPSIFLLSPFYWITQRSEMLLVAQAVAVGLSGLVLYKIGVSALKNKLSSLSILTSYFLFIGLQNAVITDFHESTIMTLPLMLTFWAIIRKKVALYFIFLLVTLGFKESTFLLGIGIGIAILFIYRRLKITLITMFLSSLWGLISIKIIIPYFSKGTYIYSVSLPSRFSDLVYSLIDNPIKQKTLFYSFLSFGFMPIFAPSFWFIIIQDYALRFLSPYFFTRWGLGLHYNAQSAVILGLASILGISFLTSRKWLLRYATMLSIVIILNAFILYRFILHGPFGLAYNPDFYKHTGDFRFLDEMVKKIPKDALVMAQNNLATRFTHQRVLLLRHNYNEYRPDYILVDVRGGQNPNDFFGPNNFDETIYRLKKDANYAMVYKTSEQFIFKRKD